LTTHFVSLATRNFESSNRDYGEAWKKYSKGVFDDAIVDCCKALESAEKVVLRKLDPGMDVDVVASSLLKPCTTRVFFPSRLQTFHTQLRVIFETAVPPVRNQPGIGHGSAGPR
jgi:hypothetical protein